MHAIKRLFTQGSGPEEPRRQEIDHHEHAKEDLEKYDNGMVYCELCQQVFVSFDVFYSHRMASESMTARCDGEDEFSDYVELEAGDEFPEGATVGDLTPCEPSER